MMNKILFKNGTFKDLNQIFSIERNVFNSEAWSIRMLKDELKSFEDRNTLVIVSGLNILGYCMYRLYLDEIHYLDILDCNGGDHGQHFATNFNPEINIREITQKSKFYKNGKWITGDPLSKKIEFDFPEVGKRNMYLMYHEELESLVKNFRDLKQARFWMTFGDQYLNYLNVLENVGLTSIKPIKFKNMEIIALEFLKEVLPDPKALG